jgi:antitoxin component YwqK of YwqJK toxin-antitoxin module
MKKLFLPFLLCFAITGCSLSEEEMILKIENEEAFDYYTHFPTCDCGELDQNSEGRLTDASGNLFTGTCQRFYPQSGQLMEERQILKGEYHGYRSLYSMEGELVNRNLYRRSKLISAKGETAKSCGCKELTEREEKKYFDNVLFTGICTNMYNDTIPALRAEYRDGILHGTLIVYDTEGNPIITEKYDEGKLIHQSKKD